MIQNKTVDAFFICFYLKKIIAFHYFISLRLFEIWLIVFFGKKLQSHSPFCSWQIKRYKSWNFSRSTQVALILIGDAFSLYRFWWCFLYIFLSITYFLKASPNFVDFTRIWYFYFSLNELCSINWAIYAQMALHIFVSMHNPYIKFKFKKNYIQYSIKILIK